MEDFQEMEAQLAYEMYIKYQVFLWSFLMKDFQGKEAQVISQMYFECFWVSKVFFWGLWIKDL